MKWFKPEDIPFIQDRACERIAEVFDALGIEYTERHDYLQAACPVHGGDNQRAMFWAIRSNHWQCKTRGCHDDPVTGPSNSVFGLVRGAMSRKTEKEWSFPQAVSFVAQALGLKECPANETTAQDIEIAKIIKRHRKKVSTTIKEGVPLATMTPYLKSDQVYYPNRGISPEIIAKYHISFCNIDGKPMYKRAFFPILDVTGRNVVGWSGRSIYDKCPECKMHHHPDRKSCPDKKHRGVYVKWKHSSNFRSEECLYNIWYAKPFISKTGTVILCEGPGDVWSYEAAGIRNSVALLGTSMSRQQRLMLQNAGALTLICTFDNDKAGQKAMEKIEKDLMHYFRIFCVTPDTVEDVGDMFPEDISLQIGPILAKASRAEMLSDDYVVEEKNG
jgi:5S rRNA maturation endonuclease (ribonuclease M5)